jgi:hypothetical protein
MTEAERRRHACPTCHAKAGDACIDPKRDATPRCHRTRGPGEYERHLQERIDRQTARAKASYGPLFQELAAAEVAVPTVAEVKLRERMAAARSFDEDGPVGMALCDQANRGLQWITVHHMLNEIQRRCGERWYQAIKAAVTEGFGNGIEHVCERLRKYLTTTETYVIAYFRVPDPTKLGGCRVVPAMTWAPAEPLMAVEEFNARFKLPDHFRGVGDQPDDPQGLFERTIGTITARAS